MTYSLGNNASLFLFFEASAMKNLLRKGDLGGDFQNPWEIPHMVEGLRLMTPGAC